MADFPGHRYSSCCRRRALSGIVVRRWGFDRLRTKNVKHVDVHRAVKGRFGGVGSKPQNRCSLANEKHLGMTNVVRGPVRQHDAKRLKWPEPRSALQILVMHAPPCKLMRVL